MSGKKKNKNLLVKLESTAGTGTYIVRKRNPKTLTEKLSRRMFDPRAGESGRGAHVLFKEAKIK